MTKPTRGATGVRLPAALPLRTPDGSPATLGELAPRRWLVIQLVRYFGCLPCQEWLISLDRASAELGQRGGRAAAIGGSADYQARWLHEARGVAMPLLLDPDHQLRSAVGAADPLGLRLADPRGLAAYSHALLRGTRPQRITRDTVRSPGVLVLDAELRVRWLHVGRRIGDYPPLADLLRALDRLARTEST